MTFSKEDNAAWQDSEIMREFEKIALETDVLSGPPAEAYLPIGSEEVEEEEKTWEEESDEEKLLSAIEELGVSDEDEEVGESLEKELSQVYTANLITDLQKLAYKLANDSKTNAAYTVERTIMKIKTFTGR